MNIYIKCIGEQNKPQNEKSELKCCINYNTYLNKIFYSVLVLCYNYSTMQFSQPLGTQYQLC